MGAEVCGCCGKEFGSAVRLTNLSNGPEETYLACPFCFAKVAAKEEAAIEPVVDKKHEKTFDKKKEKETVAAGVGGCGHHLGYLKERAKKTAIPDECLVCPKILQCMV